MAGKEKERIDRANQALDRVKIRQHGGRLYLRGTLPPKPGDGDAPKQYEISTGLSATTEGIAIAKAQAQEIESLLMRDRFDWTPYLKGKQKSAETVSEWVARFEADFWSKRTRTLSREESWKSDYLRAFNHLPADEAISAELLRRTAIATPPETRTRQQFCRSFMALAKFAGIELDLSDISGNYKPQVQRKLPSDERIAEIYGSIQNPKWRWVFGMLATYGLRPHEIFWIDCSGLKDSPVLPVGRNTKTGERLVWPSPSQWWSEWELWEVDYPNIRTTGKSNKELGSKVSGWFRDRIPFSAYYLRDAYAVRCSVLGVDPAIACRWMGNSLQVYYEHYHKFISQAHNQQAWEMMKRREMERQRGDDR